MKKQGPLRFFCPQKEHIYPEHFQTEVSLKYLPGYLCGKFRPVHFAGVATVVTKLFNIVQPNLAVFGQKDYQQLQIIRQLTRDLDFDIEIVGGAIVREDDGLAMSSRNAYLSEAQRKSAVCLNKSLAMAQGTGSNRGNRPGGDHPEDAGFHSWIFRNPCGVY